jgi:tetratricopeptide (TPR) repeat protein
VFSDKADFARAIVTLKQAINVAKTLNKADLSFSPEITLANIYHVTDQNAAAAVHARRSLTLAQKLKSPVHEAVSLRILAISEFFAYKSQEAEKLLAKSIEIAQEKLTSDQVVQSYIYLGVIFTENGNFTNAKRQFEQALLSTSGIDNAQRKAYFMASINGYYARSQFLAGDSKKAIVLYTLAIEQAERAGIKQKLALSQLNEGLAESYLAQGNKTQSVETAKLAVALATEALTVCEINNTALGFAVNRRAVKPCD